MEDVALRALMSAYQAGDLAAFEALHDALAPALRGWLRSRVRTVQEADDLLQDTFLQLHRARHTYDARYPVEPWAFAIARHVWLMHRRTLSRRPHATDSVDDVHLPVRADAEAYAERAHVRQALADVAESRRRPMIWHHVFGFSFREIAERLGIRESAAKLRSSRGMADLRDRLDRRHDDE
jgi:RNA polymerase sigma-70 factor (ECF subfamily)